MRALETRYALALYQLTQDERALGEGAALLRGSPALWQALNDPRVAREEKDRVLCRLLQGKAAPVFLDFFRLLCRRERLPLLPKILESYHLLCLRGEGGARAVYRCARQPDPADLARLEQALKARHGLGKIEFQVELEPSLLGGFVLELEGVTYDKSVRGMLRGLRRHLKEERG